MAKQSGKQTEQKKTTSKTQQPASSRMQDNANATDIIQALTQEQIPNDILSDPRLQHQSAGDLRLQAMNLMQQHGGNTQIQRLLQTDSLIQREDSESSPVLSWLDTQRHNLMEATGMESSEEAERGRATAFYSHGTYGPQSSTGAGNIGGFNVTYDPLSGIERITIKGGVKFVDGLSVSGGTITPGNPGLQDAADDATAMTGADRTSFIAQYQWTDGEKAPFVNNLKSVVQNMWGTSSTGLSFFINKPEWEWITARVVIDIQMRAMGPSDTRADDDHLIVNAVKEPPGYEAGQGTGAEVRPGTSSAFDQEMDISSQDIHPRGDNMLTLSNTVYFEHDSTELSSDAKSTLNTWVATYQGAPTNAAANPTSATIQGFTSARGSEEYNLDLGLRRTEAVKNYISSKGFTDVNNRVVEVTSGESGAVEGASPAQQGIERRVEIYVDSGAAQVVAAHEFGHAFGLGDEYATGSGSAISGTGAAAGTASAHDTMARAMTNEAGRNLPGAIHENTDSIMSLGNVVRPQHYATFHNALTQVTGVSEWSIRS